MACNACFQPASPNSSGDTMSLSMHAISVPAFVRTFKAMQACIDKAQAHADARRFDSANYLAMRLAPDMLPLSKQVQIATDMAKGCVARLAGHDIPKWDDSEATLADLRARLDKAIAYVQSVPADQIDGTEDKEILLPLRTGEMRLAGQAYALGFVLPNVYFHATAAYALLRHAGVELGKRDFLG
jgi:hypothetical protein